MRAPYYLSVLFFLGLLFQACEEKESSTQKSDPVIIKTPELIYEFVKDSFEILNGVVKRNQYFSEILLPHDVAYGTIDQLVKNSKDIFDIRKIRVGNPYTILFSKDSLRKAQYLIYEIDKVDYVVYELLDSLEVKKKKKPVEIRIQEAAGIIDGSLYLTMINQNVNPMLSNDLAEIFAWTIDFYRIQKGDKFKVIYEEAFVDSISVGIKHIKSAVFDHKGEEYYAIYFEQDGEGGYYDFENHSLKRPFLKAPVKYSRISSRYTRQRFHPVQKRWKAHLGTDYAAATGTPIMTTADGVIIAATYSKYNGNYVKVKHNSTYTTQYLHMSKIKLGIKPGVRVKQGDVIGYVGQTGLATGPHVCYRFWRDGRQVDPFKQKMPKSEPLKKENISAFNEIKKRVKKDLKKIDY